MSLILEKAASPEVLNIAWKRISNDKVDWKPGLSKWEMERNLIYHISELADDLRSGKYKPDPVKFFPVNKGDGKQRIISAHTLRDKMAQRAVLTVLEPIFEKLFHHDSFGYRPGRSVNMAISKVKQYIHCGLTWLVDADIQSYFDEIPHKPLIKAVKYFIKDKQTINLIKKWLDAGTVRRGILSYTKGIPQGAVLSPLLCNIYLTQWDNDMASKNLPFVRFADDFLVFAKTENDAQKAHSYVKKSLHRLKLALNPQKTRVTQCGKHVKFLGQTLHGNNSYHKNKYGMKNRIMKNKKGFNFERFNKTSYCGLRYQ